MQCFPGVFLEIGGRNSRRLAKASWSSSNDWATAQPAQSDFQSWQDGTLRQGLDILETGRDGQDEIMSQQRWWFLKGAYREVWGGLTSPWNATQLLKICWAPKETDMAMSALWTHRLNGNDPRAILPGGLHQGGFMCYSSVSFPSLGRWLDWLTLPAPTSAIVHLGQGARKGIPLAEADYDWGVLECWDVLSTACPCTSKLE